MKTREYPSIMNDIPAWKLPSVMNTSSRRLRNSRLMPRKRSASSGSRQNPLTSRMPCTEFSTRLVSSPVLRRTSRKPLCIRPWNTVPQRMMSGSGTSAASIIKGFSAVITATAPIMVSEAIRMSSGQWCATSVICMRSLDIRAMIWPVGVLSK